MSNIVLALQATPIQGADIQDVADKAIEIAETLGCAVFFDFNGTEIIAKPKDTALALIKDYLSKNNLRAAL